MSKLTENVRMKEAAQRKDYTNMSKDNVDILKKDIVERLYKCRYSMHSITPDLYVYKEHINKLDKTLSDTKMFLSGFTADHEKKELNHVFMHIYDISGVDTCYDIIDNSEYFVIPDMDGMKTIYIVDLDKIVECEMIAALLPKKYRKVFFQQTHYNNVSYGRSFASVGVTEAEFYRKLIAKKVVDVKRNTKEEE